MTQEEQTVQGLSARCAGSVSDRRRGSCLLAGSMSQLCWLFPALTEIAREIRDLGPQKEKIKEGYLHSCYPSNLSLNPSMTQGVVLCEICLY